ncbi:CHASE3 domain-containing protein [Microcoleus sp. FACHB-831]|uniref:sensor histidine kinase n=1 Tax=Microcoleus sp. FACHB-831 TaxID=2692827 RepID=UPI001689BB61|nr:CHASE3 domain-containing protein [Microcoleus sp. FACHB-831]MBD1924254.1 CHASE3 domain-containing protein [Microcoleus sp. FACHB-831]
MRVSLPDNEIDRIEALLQYKILDTAPEESFDDLTRLASYICETPIALISLIDTKRQWIKSKVGLDLVETPRDDAFCAHTILQSDVFIVPDALADERFATNPLVTSEPYIRFYAGIPVITPDGHALGALCAIDRVPRELSPKQLEALRTIARRVTQQLELRHNLESLKLAPTNEYKLAEKTRRKFFKKIAGGFGLTSTILVLIATVSYHSIREVINTSKQVAQTQKKITKLEELLSYMKDAETGQRGYIITGKNYYLEPYEVAVENVERQIDELRKLTADNPKHQQQIDILVPLIAAKSSELKQTIELRSTKGFEAALQVVLSDRGKSLMDNIRYTIREMENEEARLLNQRAAIAQTSARNTIVIVSAGIILTFVILALVYYLIYREMTDRKRAEQALKVQQQWLEVTLSSIGDAVITTDTSAVITFMNPVAQALTGWPINEAKERKIDEVFCIINEQTRQPAEIPVERALREGIVLELADNTILIQRDGREIPIDDSVAPIRSKNGVLQGAVLIFRDISKRKLAEAEMYKTLEKEKELNELKSRFVSMASHEFRTPLSTILFSAGLLEDYGHKLAEDKKITHLHRIQAGVQRMTELLDDVLLIGKAEAKKLEFKPALLDLENFCRELVEEIVLGVGIQHKVNFVVRNSLNSSSTGSYTNAHMDEKLLRHILNNLLSNAIKYSPEGSTVDFEINCEDEQAIFYIKDAGIGIPPEDLKRLYESFHRAKNVGTIRGTGLGLAIVKRSVDLHGGQIDVKSEVGVGTTFTVRLPLNNQEKN